MSDYEGEGWQPVNLTARQDQPRTSAQILVEHVAPKGQDISDIQPATRHNRRREKHALGSRTTNTFHPLLQDIRPRAHHATGGRPIERSFEINPLNQNLKSYALFEANPDTPSDIYELDIAWRPLLRAITETADLRASDIARNSLDNISTHSEAFIRTPESDSMRIEIWGTPEQCRKAKTRLQAWEGHLRTTGTRPSHKLWAKEHAFDGRREDRKRQEQWQELEDQALQEADDSEFEYEAYLVWPQEFDLDAYVNKYEPETLRAITKEFGCRFRHERKVRPRVTKVQAQSESDLLSAYQRLINLVKEMIAQKNRGTHGTFCRLPSPDAYRDSVVSERVSEATTNAPFRIMLSGDGMPESRMDEWLDSIKFYEKQNRAEIQASINTFLKGLYMGQCHVRLRVSFGDLHLRSFPRAKAGGFVFGFNEFIKMVQGRRTELYDPALQQHQEDLTWIVDRLAAMEEFRFPEDSYKQIFEFKGTDVTNRLRLEIEMQPGYDLDEPQVCSQRWLTFKTYGKNENVLGLRMIDFERPSYMIRADAYDLFTNDHMIKDMEAFRSAVSFKPAHDGIKAFPKMRSTFPGHDKLVAVTEFTSKKFQFKDTDGIVELRREDIYMQDTSSPSKLPDSTRFELFYYYPEWDNLLGEMSNVKPGEDISWHRDITTFFPNHVDPDRPRSLPRGFKTFMKELYELQTLVGQALTT